MQERRYRPGDALDDYCPRERRITDHAVVAMIGDEIKRTRCAVCDAEHEYKGAKMPAPRRKAERPAALFAQVLDALQPPAARPPAPPAAADDAASAPAERAAPPLAAPPEPAPATPAPPPAVGDRDEGPVRRPLIRAQLPRREGEEPVRSLPEFTLQALRNRGRHGQGRGRHGGAFGHATGAGEGGGRARGRRRRRHKSR